MTITVLGFTLARLEWSEQCDCEPEPPRLSASGGGQFEIAPFGFGLTEDQVDDRELRQGFERMGWL